MAKKSMQRRSYKGGESAHEFGEKAFGLPGQQHAQAGSNIIAVSHGGNLTQMAVPAALLLANNTIKRSRSYKGGESAHEFGEKAFGLPGQQHAQAGSNIIEVKHGGNLTQLAVPAALLLANNTIKRKSSKSRTSIARGGDLTQLAVPAALLLANNTINRSRNVRFTRKRRGSQKRYKMRGG